MKLNLKKRKEARDAFIDLYKPKLANLVPYFTAGIPVTEKMSILASCIFENIDDLSDETTAKIEKILPKSFEYDGEKYSIKVQYAGISYAEKSWKT